MRYHFNTMNWERVRNTSRSDIVNINETCVQLDMPTSRIIAGRGAPSNVARLSMHSAHMAAVLGARAEGT